MPTLPQSASTRPDHSLAFLAIVGGLVLLVGGLILGALFSWAGAANGLSPVVTTPAFALTAVGLFLGWPLLAYGAAAARDAPGRLYTPSGTRSRWLLVALAIVAGEAVLQLNIQPGVLLPILNFVALALPPVLILAYAGRRLHGAGLADRTVWGFLVGGASLGVVFAMIAEVLIILAIAIVALLVVVSQPGGAAGLQAFSNRLAQTETDPASERMLAQLLVSPAGLAVSLLVAAGVAPLVEEFAKGLPVALLARRYRLSPSASFLAGMACGAGFAVVEGLLYGAIQAQPGSWALNAALRPGAALVHSVGAGMVGWGWGEAIVRHRPRNLLLGYLVAIGLHATWNTLAILQSLADILQTQASTPRIQSLAGFLSIALVLVLFLLALAVLRLLIVVTARLREPGLMPPAPASSIPVEMAPVAPSVPTAGVPASELRVEGTDIHIEPAPWLPPPPGTDE